jgi:hypothetical protein
VLAVPHHVAHARERLIVEVVPGIVAIRPRLPVAGDRAVDEPRIHLPRFLRPRTEARHHAGSKAIDDHVGRSNERVQLRSRSVGLQIEHDRFLARVDDPEQPRESARDVSTRRLDLDHLRTEPAQDHRRVRPRQVHREIENTETTERRPVLRR